MAEELRVELHGCHRRHDRPTSGDRLAPGDAHAGGATVGDQHALYLGSRANDPTCVEDDPRERVDKLCAATSRDRHPAELERAGEHMGHEARGRLIRSKSGVEDPGSEEAVRGVGAKRVAEPGAGRRE